MNYISGNIKSNESPIKRFNYISIFLLIYLSSSFYALSMKGSISLGLLITTAIVTFILNSCKTKIRISTFFLIFIILIGSIFTLIINSDGINQYLIFWTALLSAYLIYISIDISDFIIIYTSIMYFLSIFSLITFVILLISPNIYTNLPTVTNNAGLTMHNLLFSVVSDNSYFNSNFGLFWEPGAYQTFINLALFFQMFILKDLDIKKIIVFLITIFTTFSTTGYIAAFIIIITFFFTTKEKVKEEVFKRNKTIYVIMILLIIGILSFNSLPNQIKFKVFGKLKSIINPNLVTSSSSYVSTTARMDAMKIPIINWLENPIFGVGFTKLSNYKIDMNTNFLTATPLNWFGLFGFPLAIILNYYIWRWTKPINGRMILKVMIFIFLTFITLSEYYNMNAFYLAFIMYGTTIKFRVK